ncbi:prolyl-tRNA synthetase [Candidatus Saccharibacteria bacterium]|nr:prolyl-tRNA synthetase [Candidatus Saccharibacteria bacterium]
MKRSQLYIKTRKDAPGDEQAKNAQLLIRAGFIHKEMAGVYTYLPLGLRTLNKIVQIIREEMNAIGGQEMQLSTLQQQDSWVASGRWSDDVMDVWFRTQLANGSTLGLAPTHEEPLTAIMKNFVSSYHDLPFYTYQFQTKFRNELRSKSGLMRGREFLMKDLYSFSKNKEEHDEFYEQCADAYMKIFDRLGLGGITYRTFASGGSFSKYSDEFQTLSPVGEDTIYVHEGKGIAINQEVYNDEVLADLGITKEELVEKTAVEVGNIFTLGTKYSDALGLEYTDEKGEKTSVFMGSYGIGPSRVMGLIAEHFADEKGLVWPLNVSPYHIYLVTIGDVADRAEQLIADLEAAGVEVLYDDRDERPGAKFADAELMGIPYRVVLSERTLAEEQVELTERRSGNTEMVSLSSIVSNITSKIS